MCKSQEPIDHVTLWGEDPPEAEEDRNFFNEQQPITGRVEEPDSDE